MTSVTASPPLHPVAAAPPFPAPWSAHAPQLPPPPAPSAPAPRRVGRTVGLAAVGLLVSLCAASFALGLLGLGGIGLLDEYGIALLVGLAASLLPVAVIRFLGRRNPAPLWLYAAAFGWGGLVAAETAGWVNTAVDALILAPISDGAVALAGPPLAGPVEEPLKALGVLLAFVLCARHVRGSRDGFVIGALVGLGFNWAETATYIVNGAADSGVAPWATQFGARFALLALGGHALWTGLFGLFLGLTRQPGRRAWLRFAPLTGLLIVTVAHASYNGLIVVLGGGAGDAEEVAAPAANTVGQFALAFGAGSVLNLVFVPVWVLAAVMLYRSGRWQRPAPAGVGSPGGLAALPVAPDGGLQVAPVGGIPQRAPATVAQPFSQPVAAVPHPAWAAVAAQPVAQPGWRSVAPPVAQPVAQPAWQPMAQPVPQSVWPAPPEAAPAAAVPIPPVPIPPVPIPPVPIPPVPIRPATIPPADLPPQAPMTLPAAAPAPTVRPDVASGPAASVDEPVAPSPRRAAAARLTAPDIPLPQLLLAAEQAPLAAAPS
ncbi:PrsW family glutamic-type intramembrane protease [Pseudonocardia sp.]|uniref:PrsW family intramembrane metalloprotease n=1 Tax=Pseudonocardia sp. TaxID=60912 RepID=UPI003D0A389F